MNQRVKLVLQCEHYTKALNSRNVFIFAKIQGISGTNLRVFQVDLKNNQNFIHHYYLHVFADLCSALKYYQDCKM